VPKGIRKRIFNAFNYYGRKILWRKGSAGPEKIGDQEEIAGSLMILITRGVNGEVGEVGGQEWKGERRTPF
jgi:hypothetical protein